MPAGRIVLPVAGIILAHGHILQYRQGLSGGDSRLREKRRIREPIVAIAQDPDEGTAITKALNMLPIDRIIFPGDRVVIVPNWVKAKGPETGTVVGPGSLKVLINLVKARRPGRLVVAAGSGGDPTPTVMEQVGYKQVIDEEGVEFVDLNYGPYRDIELELHGGKVPRLKVNKLYDETDVLISFTQVKVHEEATVSLGIKNIALSWPPAEIHGFPKKDLGIHDDLHGFIAAMAEHFPIDLAILSTSKGMVGTGPDRGKPVNADIIVAGCDPVATDVIGARLIGFRPQAVHYLFTLIERGLGEGDPNKMSLKGLPLYQAEEAFSRAAYGSRVVIDDGVLVPL
ncbi:MAG TPA: DUF362 domain-containing protein [Firmicutes bacterium]|nr:DUF362 domain-containing protein [Bacillota bacterium]